MGFYTVLLVVHTIIVVFLIMMVLIQRTDSDGLGGLSGGGGNQFLSGRSTANLMTRTTAILAAGFMISSLVLAIMAGRMTSGSIVDSVPAEAASTVAPAVEKQGATAKKESPAKKDAVTEKATKPASAPSVPKPE